VSASRASGRQPGRRAVLPGADELFRSTEDDTPAGANLTVIDAASRRRKRASGDALTPSGRERHEEKITVYVSEAELLLLERARLTLRAEHGVAVDRGRIVREALTFVLADLNAHGETSLLVRQLREG
jgi:hypothetical protein